ncbi:hypothetical protein JYU19_02085 [bacterium AH-315-J21]|nr:hypothetical protein [bacterium AH-315-J21]
MSIRSPRLALEYSDSDRKLRCNEERLQLLGITIEIYREYRKLFLEDRDKSCHYRLKGKKWSKMPFSWNDTIILKHLCGELTIGIPFHDRVKTIMLDIDCHGGSSRGSAINVARRAIESIPAILGEPIVYQSSDSGGIRIVWFLDGYCNREKLRKRVEDFLKEGSVAVVSGICEVRMSRANDRIPFGCNSMLLDPTTFEPCYRLNLSETIQQVSMHRANTVVIRSQLGGTLCELNGNHDYTNHELLLRYGLPVDVSTNECLLPLARYFKSQQGMSDDEVRNALRNWISRRHNGNSDAVNNGKINETYLQIDRIVKYMKVPQMTRNSKMQRTGLSESEVHELLGIPGSYRFLSSLFSILTTAKGECLKKKSSKSVARVDSPKAKEYSTNKCGRKSTQNIAVTNGAENPCPVHIDLGKNLLRRFKVPRSENTSFFLRDLESFGLIALKRRAYQMEHKSTQYWINFPFDLSSIINYTDFESAIWNVMGYDEIRSRFSPHYATKLKQKFENESKDTS